MLLSDFFLLDILVLRCMCDRLDTFHLQTRLPPVSHAVYLPLFSTAHVALSERMRIRYSSIRVYLLLRLPAYGTLMLCRSWYGRGMTTDASMACLDQRVISLFRR
jgi:hypothetical protein